MEKKIITTHDTNEAINRTKRTLLAKKIETIDYNKASMDQICKKLLADKTILARILKTCVKEYVNCSLKDIEDKYIEGIPRISEIPVHRDEVLKTADSITGIRNEDESIREGTITYDIRFKALNPLAQSEAINMIINVEGQNDFYPRYPLLKRGVYYGSRMISSQYGTVFINSHYEKIEKVYSIWICLRPPKYRKNSINLYSLQEVQLTGNFVENEEHYDLMAIAMICLGDEDDENCKGLIKLLSTLFSGKKKTEEKKKILENEFDMAMTQTIEKEVREMGSYADWFIEEGHRRGRESGMMEGILISIKNLVKNTGMSLEEAMNVLSIPENDRAIYVDKLKIQ